MQSRAWLGAGVLFVLGASALGAPGETQRGRVADFEGPGAAPRHFVSADHPAESAGPRRAGEDERALPTVRREATMEPRARRDLFNRFHPNLGWTPGRLVVIRWRVITQDVGPTAREQEWLAHYGDWLAVWKNWFPDYETR